MWGEIDGMTCNEGPKSDLDQFKLSASNLQVFVCVSSVQKLPSISDTVGGTVDKSTAAHRKTAVAFLYKTFLKWLLCVAIVQHALFSRLLAFLFFWSL